MSAHVSICACIPGVCVCVCLSYICPGMSARVSICARIGVDTVCVYVLCKYNLLHLMVTISKFE